MIQQSAALFSNAELVLAAYVKGMGSGLES